MDSDIPKGDEIAARTALADRNLDILADRLGWPPGTADTIRGLETAWPEWSFGYSTGGLPAVPDPVWTAQLRAHRYGNKRLEAPTAEELERLVRRAEGDTRFITAF